MLGNIQTRYVWVAVIASLLPYLLFLFEKRYGMVIKGLLIIGCALWIQVYLLSKSYGMMHSLFLFMTMMYLKILPGFMMGKYTIFTTKMSEIAYCMHQMKMPDVLIIPITVMQRFFYTIFEDYSQVKQAMYMHGLSGIKMIFHPIRLVEYRLVPLLMVITKTADEVAISALTRGMQIDNQKRTYRTKSSFHIADYGCFCFAIFLMVIYGLSI